MTKRLLLICAALGAVVFFAAKSSLSDGRAARIVATAATPVPSPTPTPTPTPSGVVIEAGVNDAIPFTEQDIPGDNTAIIPAATYASATDLRNAISNAFAGSAGGQLVRVEVTAETKLRIWRTTETFTLDWASRPTASAATALGWDVADVTSTLSSTAQTALPF